MLLFYRVKFTFVSIVTDTHEMRHGRSCYQYHVKI